VDGLKYLGQPTSGGGAAVRDTQLNNFLHHLRPFMEEQLTPGKKALHASRQRKRFFPGDQMMNVLVKIGQVFPHSLAPCLFYLPEAVGG